MVTIDGVDYVKENLSEEGKARIEYILKQQRKRIELIFALQDVEESIRYHGEQIREEQ